MPYRISEKLLRELPSLSKLVDTIQTTYDAMKNFPPDKVAFQKQEDKILNRRRIEKFFLDISEVEQLQTLQKQVEKIWCVYNG